MDELRTLFITKNKSNSGVNPLKIEVHPYETKINQILQRIEQRVSETNLQLIRKYDRQLVNESLAHATRLKNLETVLNLTTILNKDWNQVDADDIKELVYNIVTQYSNNGQETHTTYDHKKILKIFFRWVKLGSRSTEYLIECDGIVSANAQMYSDSGYLSIWLKQNGEILEMSSTTSPYGVVAISSTCSKNGLGGGCLIATATFDSELAPQVQKLREIRDSKLLSTESGSQFMEHFNTFYYSFSPIIADYERENPVFKELIRAGITPMLSTLSLMDYAESESEVLGIGISLIILNGIMYVGLPIFGIMIAKKRF